MRGIEAQFLALQKGFNELIPQHLLKPFDQKELEVCVGGWGSLPPSLSIPRGGAGRFQGRHADPGTSESRCSS